MEKLIYVKFSEDRAPEFCIKTKIMSDDDCKIIYKSSIDGTISEHLQLMPERHQWLLERYTSDDVVINDVTRTDKGMRFAFVKGESVQAQLDRYIAQADCIHAKNLIQTYIKKMLNISAYRGDFEPDNDGKKIFGNVVMKNVDLANVSDIDMIFSNILIDDNKWNVIDYEWTFDFPIPQKFILYRALLYWKNTSNVMENHSWDELMSWGEISEKEAKVFDEMETAFQHYVAGNTETFRTKAYHECKPQYSINQMNQRIIDRQLKNEKLRIYFPTGHGYDEANAQDFYRPFVDNQYKLFEIDIKEAFTEIRLDPVEQPCALMVQEITLAGQELNYMHNGILLSEKVIGFDHNDPQIILNIAEKTGKLRVGYWVLDIDDALNLSDVLGYERRLREKQQHLIDELTVTTETTIKRQQEMIDAFTTTIWYKGYCAAKNIKRHLKK